MGILHQLFVGTFDPRVKSWVNLVIYISSYGHPTDTLQNRCLKNITLSVFSWLFRILSSSTGIIPTYQFITRPGGTSKGWVGIKIIVSTYPYTCHPLQYHHTDMFQDLSGPNPGRHQRSYHWQPWGALWWSFFKKPLSHSPFSLFFVYCNRRPFFSQFTSYYVIRLLW